MTTLLKATTEAEARRLERVAFNYAVANQRAKGAEWSPVLTDNTEFGIVFDGNVAAAFSTAELGRTVNGRGEVTLTRVAPGERQVTDEQGTRGTWTVRERPVAPPEGEARRLTA